MKKSENWKRKSLLLLLAAVVFSGVLTESGNMRVQAAALQNPRKSNQVVTYDCVYFGNYPQSDATGNAKEPIKWRVLSVKGDDAFLVADKNLDIQSYSDGTGIATWQSCTLRSWLNGYGASQNVKGKDYSTSNFIDQAFSKAEQNAIYTTRVRNMDNPDYGTYGGYDTDDKIFLLSYEEVTNPAYGFSAAMVYDMARERDNTAYVAAGGSVHTDYANSAGYKDDWWLRTPGYRETAAAYVSGWLAYGYGAIVAEEAICVCPALHLNLQYTDLYTYAGTVSCDNSEWPEEYTIYYMLNGGINADNPTRYFGHDAEDIVLKAPKRSGYSFDGWYTDKACKNKIASIKVAQKKDVVVYAKWTKVKKPGKVVIKSAVNNKKRQVKLTFKKIKGADGYEIQYSTDKKFKKSVKNLTTTNTSKIMKSLRKSKTYYIKVRAYKIDSAGEKIYGSYSSIRKVKVEK